MSLTKDAILSQCNMAALKRKKVSTPEWAVEHLPAHVYVRQLSAAEFSEFQNTLPDKEEDFGTEVEEAARWTVGCACDDAGELIFEADDAATLIGGAFSPLARCAKAAIVLNAVDAFSQQEREGNSPEGQPESSPST
jgi:hypothetical protein